MFTDKHHRPVRRAASDSTTHYVVRDDSSSSIPGPALLAVPMLGQTLANTGSCRHLDLSLNEHETASSEDISPECVSPAVLLVPPPYPEASTATMDDVSCTSKSDQGIQITVVEEQPKITTTSPTTTTVTIASMQTQVTVPETRQPQEVTPGQRVRIRLCDTRLDSGIGDDKHSQESQPSSSGACDIEHADNHEVIVQVQHSADLS